MKITNTTLINLISTYGEETIVAKLESKLAHDAKQKSYHKTYNQTRNAIVRELKARGITLEDVLAAKTA